MTRAEAAAQAASALSTMMRLAVGMHSPTILKMFDLGEIVTEEARAKLDLAAALLVLTAPAEARPFTFLDAPVTTTSETAPVEQPFRVACCGEVFSTYAAWTSHRLLKEYPAHKP